MTGAETPQVSLGRTVKCPHCGASLEITPEALAYVCKYCGWIGTTEEVEQKGYLMVDPLDADKIRSSINEFLRKQLKKAFGEVNMNENRPTDVPIYLVQVHAHTEYNGYRQETKVETYPVTVGDGRGGTRTEMRSRSYPVYVPVRGEFDESPIIPFTARKHSTFFGVDEIIKKAQDSPSEPLDVKKLLDKKFECLEVELLDSEARSIAETMIEDEHRRRAEKMTTKLFDCYTDTKVLSSKLVFYPVYTFAYEYRGKSFRGTVDGAGGAIVKVELPMTIGLRAFYMALGYAGITSIVLLGAYLQSLGVEPILSLVPAVVAGAFSVVFYKGTTSQRIKRSR